MKTIALAVVAVIAVLAAAFAWQRNQALQATKTELASANSQLQKANSDILAIKTETTALRKEFADQKLAMDTSLAELSAAKSFLDAEKAAGALLREELMKTKEQLASMGGKQRSARGTSLMEDLSTVRMVPIRPTVVIRAAPGTAAVKASPAGPGGGGGYSVPAR